MADQAWRWGGVAVHSHKTRWNDNRLYCDRRHVYSLAQAIAHHCQLSCLLSRSPSGVPIVLLIVVIEVMASIAWRQEDVTILSIARSIYKDPFALVWYGLRSPRIHRA